jgi:hypothetical protein
MRTKFMFLIAAFIGAFFILYGLKSFELTYTQVRALILFEVVLLAVLAVYLYNILKPEPTEPTEKPKIVTWLGNDYKLVPGGGCTECCFLKACHFTGNPDIPNRFMDDTRVSCMMDNVCFEKLEPKTYTIVNQ